MRVPRPDDMIAEGDLLWTPDEAFVSATGLTRFRTWLEAHRGLTFEDYDALWRWSVEHPDIFWMAIWDCYAVISDGAPRLAMQGESMLDTVWFKGSRVNYAEHLLRHEQVAPSGKTALFHASEHRSLARMSWSELGDKVRALATSLRRLGIGPGDRVVSYMPNTPETAIAMLATIAIGGVWSAAAPEFGAALVLERFGQIEPKLAFFADGYSYNGKIFNRTAEIESIVAGLPSLEAAVWFPFVGGPAPHIDLQIFDLESLLSEDAPSIGDFRFERVAYDHPLWVLYSSGTTGKPKAIVHSHVGMVVEHLKSMNLHNDFTPEDRIFFYTTTGWMMWNAILSSLIVGSAAVLYDGSPTHKGLDGLWRLASEAEVTVFGASPTLVQNMKKGRVRPRKIVNLTSLRTVLCSGAPAPPEVFHWIYTDVKEDLRVTSSSGGTDLCSALVGAVPLRPIYAGEIQGRLLGMNVRAWNEDGQDVLGEVGELVVLTPFPSMPLYFWDDPGKERYRDTYFDMFPGVWRHGDRIKFNARGGCYIYGRSDSTLNRFGVRIGTAEIYRVVQEVPGVAESLVVCCEAAGGDGYYMPLFVALEPGLALTEGLADQIRMSLREHASPRHVPDEIHQAPAIPFTLTGKKMEVPIRRILMGTAPEKAASRGAMAEPQLLDWYVAFARRTEVRARVLVS